jgi:hypothetical protein
MPAASPSGDVPPDDPACGEPLRDGIWLTFEIPVPPELITRRSAGNAADFSQGGMLDEMAPGPVLAAFLTQAADSRADASVAQRLADKSDDDLVGMLRGWRKLASWAAAGELSAAAELSARRQAEATASGEREETVAIAANAEIAAALTLTGCAAGILTDRAGALRELPGTFAALSAGRIDMPKALVILTGLSGQDPALSRAIEAQVLGKAPAQTTGQLRAAVNRALLAADPDAADKRRQAEEKMAWVESRPEPGGVSATLTGRYLPVTATVAAWNRIDAIARHLKTSGTTEHLDGLRARVYLALLTGQPIPCPAGSASTDADPRPEESGWSAPKRGAESTAGTDAECPDGTPAGSRAGTDTENPAGTQEAEVAVARDTGASPSGPMGTTGLAGSVNLTVPLATLLAKSDAPGELGGFGPITGHSARQIAASAAGSLRVRWCVTVTGDNGEAAGHGCAVRTCRDGPQPADSGWTFNARVSPLARGECTHERESTAYRPPPALRHLVQVRHQRCTFPGCRRAAAKCDQDHSTPYAQGGKTCECNLSPLCEYHHKVKHSQGWRLEQPEPGVITWITPSGRRYFTGPDTYPT